MQPQKAKRSSMITDMHWFHSSVICKIKVGCTISRFRKRVSNYSPFYTQLGCNIVNDCGQKDPHMFYLSAVDSCTNLMKYSRQ